MNALVEIVKERLDQGIFEYSLGPYANRYFLVEKKNGKWRFIQDVRHLNKVTTKDANVSPIMEDVLERLAGYPCYTILDAMSGYDQIPLSEESRDLTAIWTPLGLVRLAALPQGFRNSVAIFERIMSRTPGELKGTCAENFVDDITVKGKTKEINETLLGNGCRVYMQ
jgi:hypothetical protein